MAIVNETFARELFRKPLPVGGRFKTSATDSHEIVGSLKGQAAWRPGPAVPGYSGSCSSKA